MQFEEAVATVEQKLDRGRLSKTEEMVFRHCWEGQSYSEIAQISGYDPAYIKDTGYRLWQKLSEAFGEKVTKQNFKGILRRVATSDRLSSTSPQPQASSPSHQDWGEAIDVSIFYGRTQELATLHTWIVQNRCRLVTVLGMGGMGKTALSIKSAETIQSELEFLVWRSLRDAPPIEELLTSLIQSISQQQSTDLPGSVSGKLSRLIELLKRSRCLVILDNFESVFKSGKRAGVYRNGYEMYGELLKRVGEIAHQSCLILTSREKPQEVAALEGITLPVRSLSLSGLNITEGNQIIAAKGLSGDSKDLQELINLYGGNPLALKISTTSILDLFNGQVSAFLQQATTVFNGIHHLLNQQISRLPELEEHIMTWLAIDREPTSIGELQADLTLDVPRGKLLEAVESLSWRSLIEVTSSGYTQQPVVMEYMSDHIIDQIYEELTTAKIQLFMQVALVKVQTKEYLKESQKRIFLAAIAEKLTTRFRSQPEIEQTLNHILQTLHQHFSGIAGYAAGNLINLLNYLEINLIGYDFSQLSVWQADLRGIPLHHVNFSQSNLAKSVFSETMGCILSVAIAVDGKQLAAGDTNGEIRVWQISDGKQLLKLEGGASWIWSVAFSLDGKTLASCDDKAVKLWNLHTHQCYMTLEGHLSWIYQIAFSSSGRLLASASTDSTIKLWDVQTGVCLNTLEGHHGFVFSVAFSPDGESLASSGHDQTLRLWDVQTGECLQILEGHTGWVWSVTFSPDSRTIASGSHDNTIKLWDSQTGTCLQTFRGHQGWIWSVAFSSDGQRLASSSDDHTIRLWDCATGQCLNILEGHRNRVWSIAFSPDGNLLASGSEDQSIRLWETYVSDRAFTNPASSSSGTLAGRCRKRFVGATNLVWSVAFSPDGQILASGSEDQAIRLWHLETGDCVRILRGHSRRVWSVAYSTDFLLASSSDDHTVKIWEPNSGTCLHTLEGHSNWVNSVTFSPNGQLLASGGGDSTVRIWDVDTGECLQILQGHTRWIWSVAFSSDGRWLVSASGDGTIKLWAIPSGDCFATIPTPGEFVSSAAFSPNGDWIAGSCGDNTVRVWDISGIVLLEKEPQQFQESVHLLHTFTGHSGRVWSVAFAPHGDHLASAGEDCQVKLWNLTTRECNGTFLGHQSRIQTVSFNHQTHTLASGSYDETVKLWNIKTGECLNTLRPPRLYEGLIIQGASGLTNAQKATLQALGATEEGKTI
jgi:WD40 repeat protein